LIDTTVDSTTVPSLKFDSQGLIPVIVSHYTDNTVLMFAWMNQDALNKTQQTGFLHLYSRSRKSLWKKGETSGETFMVRKLMVDCDQDVLLAHVMPSAAGNACHTGRRSCFYRELKGNTLLFAEG
jgi:phosphoribosyl-AMP cyclohydrolase